MIASLAENTANRASLMVVVDMIALLIPRRSTANSAATALFCQQCFIVRQAHAVSTFDMSLLAALYLIRG